MFEIDEGITPTALLCYAVESLPQLENNGQKAMIVQKKSDRLVVHKSVIRSIYIQPASPYMHQNLTGPY